MNCIVIHTVAANGGDELLLRTLIGSLDDYLGINVLAATTNNSLSLPYIPLDYKFRNKTVLGVVNEDNNCIHRMIRKVSFFPCALKKRISEFFDSDLIKFNKVIDDIDIAILCPGGFIHDYYGLELIYDLVLSLHARGKRIIVFGQSAGPFRSNESRVLAKKIFDMTEKIILRENYSKEYIGELYPDGNKKIEVFTDIAFNYKCDPKLMKTNAGGGGNRITLNFRDWNDEDIDVDKIVKKGAYIVNHLFVKGYDLEFLSTCQGVLGYKDDTLVAEKILLEARKTNPDLKMKIHKKRYSINEYLEVVRGSKYYIGMRMHAAIMPILLNIPALNIGYEPKTKGVFETIGIGDFSGAIQDPISNIIKKIDYFLEYEYELLKDIYKDALIEGQKKSHGAFMSLKESGIHKSGDSL